MGSNTRYFDIYSEYLGELRPKNSWGYIVLDIWAHKMKEFKEYVYTLTTSQINVECLGC